MKALYDVNVYRRLHNSYSYQHLYRILRDNFLEGDWINLSESKDYESLLRVEGITHFIIIDNVWNHTRYGMEALKRFTTAGVKVVAITYDPSSLPAIDKMVKEKCVSAIVLFDKQFSVRFPCKTYISDYVFDESFFPVDPGIHNGKVCIYGTIGGGERDNRFGLPVIDNPQTDYPMLYSSIQQYRGVHVLMTSTGEDGKSVAYCNKAKTAETLLCGRTPYCQALVSTTRYDDYVRSEEGIGKDAEPGFCQEDILKLNRAAVSELTRFLKNDI